MSQKKLKKLRKIENETVMATNVKSEPVKGIRQIIRENWIFLVIFLIGVICLYLNGMNGDFVSDDYASITQNPEIKSFSWAIKTGSLPAFTNFVLANIFGTQNITHWGIPGSTPYHVFNLILYLFILLVAFIFIYLLTKDKMVTMLTLVLYAVMPIHAENVTWISGRPYLLVALFVFSSLDLLILFLRTKNKKYLWFMIPALILLFLTDRIRGFAVVILSVFYFLVYRKSLGYNFKLGKVLLWVTIVTGVLALISWNMIQERIVGVNSGYNGSGGIFYNPFFQYPTSIPKYLQLMVVPADMTLYHTMYILPVWLNWVILTFFLGAVGYFFFKDRLMFFALAFIFLATAPSMAPVKVSWLVAERYLLMGSLGLCLFWILFFRRFGKKFTIPFLILFVSVVAYYAVRTIYRNADWRTNHSLWVVTCQVSPNSHNAWNNIGDDYDKLAQLEATEEGKLNQYYNSIKGFTRSTQVKPDYADAFHNRANIFYKIGRYDLARDSYETAVSFGPNLYQSYYSLIQIDLVERNFNSAMMHLNKLNTVRPNDPQVYYAAAVVYANAGMKDESRKILNQLLQVSPNFTEARNLLNQLGGT